MHAARNEACLCEGQWSLPSRTTADLNKPTAGHLCGRTSTPRTCPHGSSGTAPASFKGTTAMRAHGASLACTSAFAAAITTGLQTCGCKPVESSANRTRTASDARTTHGPIPVGPLNVLLANPAITFLTIHKIIGDLLGSFPAWDLNPVPPSIVVIDEDVRTGTFNS